MTKMLDVIQRQLTGEVPPPPIARLIGFKLSAIKPGEAVVEFEATEAHANPMGTLHGGVLCDRASERTINVGIRTGSDSDRVVSHRMLVERGGYL